MKIKKFICLILNVICSFSLIIMFLFLKNNYTTLLKISFLSLSIMLTILAIIFCRLNMEKGFKITIIGNVLLLVIFLTYHILNITNTLYFFKSVNNFRRFIISTGSKGIIVYISIQTLQVVFLPVPASIIALAGAIVYGPFWGFVYCTIGVLLGSYLSFLLGRTLGQRLVIWVAGKENAIKYANILNESGRLFLGVAFLLPFFPDDILCLISGITSMTFKYFFLVTTIFRPIGVFFMCYFGGGYIIPFYGWGLYVWAVIIIVMSTVVFLAYKYQKQIEEWLVKKFKKKKANQK